MQRALDLLVEYSDTPLLVNDDIPPTGDAEAHQYWKRRLLEKLELVAVPGEPATSETTAASAVEPGTGLGAGRLFRWSGSGKNVSGHTAGTAPGAGLRSAYRSPVRLGAHRGGQQQSGVPDPPAARSRSIAHR